MAQLVISENIETLCTTISNIRRGIVMFDGLMGAGKTRQACVVAERLKFQHIDLDDYIQEGNPGKCFVEMMRHCSTQIKQNINEKQKYSRLILISTICARDVAKILGLRNVHYVYVEKNQRVYLKQEVLEYHIKNNPRKKAEIVYRRRDPIEEATVQREAILSQESASSLESKDED